MLANSEIPQRPFDQIESNSPFQVLATGSHLQNPLIRLTPRKS